jgi:hypothetical protein
LTKLLAGLDVSDRDESDLGIGLRLVARKEEPLDVRFERMVVKAPITECERGVVFIPRIEVAAERTTEDLILAK